MWYRAKRWWCQRYGHRNVWHGTQVQCLRCGRIRSATAKGHGYLGEEYLDETDPDPAA